MGKWPLTSKGFWGSVIIIAAAAYTALTMDFERAIPLFGTGLALLGIRHHLEEIKK